MRRASLASIAAVAAAALLLVVSGAGVASAAASDAGAAAQTAGEPALHVAMVVCGSRCEREAAVAIKSMLLFAPGIKLGQDLVFHLLGEGPSLQRLAANLPEGSVKLHDIADKETAQHLAQLQHLEPSKPCAGLKLALPDIMHHHGIERVLQIDTDLIFLSDVREMHSVFAKFNATQAVAVTKEMEFDRAEDGWYHRHSKTPFFGKTGINSGLILYNTTRLFRQIDVRAETASALATHKSDIVWGDQDVLNIVLARHPDLVYVLDCYWNYRTEHCNEAHPLLQFCDYRPALADGAGIRCIHGSQQAFVEEVNGRRYIASFVSFFLQFEAIPWNELLTEQVNLGSLFNVLHLDIATAIKMQHASAREHGRDRAESCEDPMLANLRHMARLRSITLHPLPVTHRVHDSGEL